jgi:hypothetical protein
MNYNLSYRSIKINTAIAPRLANNAIVAFHKLEVAASLISHIPPPTW